MNYGEVRMMCRKLVGAQVDPDVLDGWISARYQSILDRLSWQRIEKEAILQTSAPYAEGTVSVASASNAVTGTGTTFTSAMSGMAFRVSGADVWYTFTYVSGTTGTLDRVYEGDTDTEASYAIYQNVLALPSDVRIVPDNGISNFITGNLQKCSKSEIRAMWPSGDLAGVPQMFAPYLDSSNVMQALLFPYPDSVQSLSLTYIAELSVPASTSTTMLPWMRPWAIIAGVSAEAALAEGKLELAMAHERTYETRVADMVRNEVQNQPPGHVTMASRFRPRRPGRSY